jgi:hypothetical protein
LYANTWATALGHLPDDAQARVVGLLGLDVRHGSYSEVHPVYALALKEPAPRGIERWLFFARNGGTEGGCSDNTIHPFAARNGRLTLQLPFPAGSGQPFTEGSYSFSNFPGERKPSVTRTGTDQVSVTITLPSPPNHVVVAGELDLETSSNAAPKVLARRRLARSVPAILLDVRANPSEPEDLARSLVLLLPPGQRAAGLISQVTSPNLPRMTVVQACNRFKPWAQSPQAASHPTQVHLVQQICIKAHEPF